MLLFHLDGENVPDSTKSLLDDIDEIMKKSLWSD